MTQSRALSLTFACLLAAPSLAQERHPFPMSVIEAPMTGVLDMQPHLAEITLLGDLDDVVLTSVPLPGRVSVDLLLERIDFDFEGQGLYLDGQSWDWNPGDLSVWKGTLAGAPGSDVMLTLSSLGCYGWINDGVNLTHLTSNPDANGDWSRSISRWVTEDAMSRAAVDNRALCMSDQVQDRPDTIGTDGTVPNAGQTVPAGVQTLECRIAVETDFQLYQIFGDSSAQATYVMALLAGVSDRYEAQASVVLTYPYVGFYSNANDPWTSQGGGAGSLLTEFRQAWAGNIPNGGHLATFLSGANLGGGVAYLDVICSSNWGFSVSGNLNGGVNFPVQTGGNTWDFVVVAHELGHNFSSPHTHDFCPPLDECAPNGYFGSCQSTQNCTGVGTIMSYCHLCGGGMNNITTWFHPVAAAELRAGAESSCIPAYNGNDPVMLFHESFESGNFDAMGWTLSSTARCKVRNSSRRTGQFGARLKKGGVGTGACTLGTAETWIEAPGLNTSDYSQVEVQFSSRGRNTAVGCERIELQYNVGSGWVAATAVDAVSWVETTVNLPGAAAGQSNLRLRFISNSKGMANRFEVDDIRVIGHP